MAMQVRTVKKEEDIPAPNPPSKSALALGIEERGNNMIPEWMSIEAKTKLALGSYADVLPVFEPITEPEITPPKPKAEVIPIKQDTLKQTKQISTNTKQQRGGHVTLEDDSVAYQAWLREYASLTQEGSCAQVTSRTKANTEDGKSVKVNRVLACWLEDGDKWGGTPMWDRNYGPPIDGIVNSVDYPTRAKYKQRERSSQAVRVALAHESIPAGDEWKASTYFNSVGNIQGFEGFARPPSLDELWMHHRLSLVTGKLNGPTILEAPELKGFTFYVDHGKRISIPSCKVIDLQGRRFSYSFNFMSKLSSYYNARIHVYQHVQSGIDRLFAVPWVDDTPPAKVVEPVDNKTVVVETVKALAELYAVPTVGEEIINASNDPVKLLQHSSRRLYKWFSRAERTTQESRNKSLLYRRFFEVFESKERARLFNRHLGSLGVIGPRGLSQWFYRENEELWWSGNAVSQESREVKKYTPLSSDPYDQMRAHWVYQYHCKRISESQLCRILNRIKSAQMQRREKLIKMLVDEKQLPALPPPASIIVEEANFLKGIRQKIDELDQHIEGELITAEQWSEFERKVMSEEAVTHALTTYRRVEGSLILQPTEMRSDPPLGDLSTLDWKEDRGDWKFFVDSRGNVMRTPPKPSLVERIGRWCQETGEFLAAIVPK